MNPLAPAFSRFQRSTLILGALALLLSLIGAFTATQTFFEAYLFAYLFWIGLALGCMVMLFVQHLAGGSWGALIRRPLEAGMMVLPVMAVFFIPILIGLFTGNLYIWNDADYLASHPIAAAKTAYLNAPGFIIRSIIYLAIWSYGAWFFFKKAAEQDADAMNSTRIGFRLKSVAAPWIIIYVMTMTFAGIDWAMSISPEFFSGIYSVILMIGQAISAMCFVIFMMVYLASNNEELNEALTSKRLQDLGNFLMAFTMFWAYTSISQLIIIWTNNIIETNPYYVLRFSPAWQGIGIFLIFFGFFAPFVILFSRWVKRKRRALVLVAVWAVAIRLLDLYYIMIPSYGREGFPLHWLDFAVMIGLGGIWLSVFAANFKSRPLLPMHDPRLAKVEHHG